MFSKSIHTDVTIQREKLSLLNTHDFPNSNDEINLPFYNELPYTDNTLMNESKENFEVASTSNMNSLDIDSSDHFLYATSQADMLNSANRHYDTDEEDDGDLTSVIRNNKSKSHLQWLPDKYPVFSVQGSNIHVLREPNEFYETLKTKSRNAKCRIKLSSLYLGTDSHCQELVDTIQSTLEDNEVLKCNILLDYSRGSRGTQNSRTMLLSLLKNFSDRVDVSLYHTPDLRGLWQKLTPARHNEGFGLQHMKIYIFDNDVIISGANLSKDYFTNRQDRYILFENCSRLCDFLSELIDVVSSFSFHLEPDDGVSLLPSQMYHPFSDSNDKNGDKFKARAKIQIESLITKYYSNMSSLQNDGDTWVIPLMQMGPFGIESDMEVTKSLFDQAPLNSHIYLSSGYFNLINEYCDTIIRKSQSVYHILTASPKANGFYGSSGISGLIPSAYTYIAWHFLNQVRNEQQGERIHMLEYFRDGWTFHAKGLWGYSSNSNYPSFTFIGSPNFGHRSVNRDLELQVAVITNNSSIRKDLHQEQISLFSNASEVNLDTLESPPRQPSYLVMFLTHLLWSFF